MIKKILKTILPLIIILPLHAGSADWQVVSQMPVPVQGGQAIVNDSLIYIIGGYCDSLMECCNIIQEYNPKQNTWKILEDTLCFRRYGLAADNYSDKAIIYGGGQRNNINPASIHGIEMWDFISAPYNYNYNYNFNRTFSTANVYQDNLYIFGGYLSYFQGDTLSLPYIVEYNIPTSTVTYEKELYNYNLPYQQMSALIGENIYVFGGAYYGVSNEVHKFNVNDHSWQEQPTSMQKERAAGEAIPISNSAIIIIGGYDESDQALSSTEIYNINGQSSFGAELNYPRYELMAALYDSSIYVFGGQNETNYSIFAVEKLNISDLVGVRQIPYPEHPSRFELGDNYPNPFNPSTVITFKVNLSSRVKIEIFSCTGEYIKTLINQPLAAGEYKITWDSRDKRNIPVASGLYFYKLTAEFSSETKRMLLIR
jgi:hypothetical protein